MAPASPSLERRVEVLETTHGQHIEMHLALNKTINAIAADVTELKAGQEELRNIAADHTNRLDSLRRDVSLTRADIKEIRSDVSTVKLNVRVLSDEVEIVKSQTDDLLTGQQRLEVEVAELKTGMSAVLEKLDQLIER